MEYISVIAMALAMLTGVINVVLSYQAVKRSKVAHDIINQLGAMIEHERNR